YTAGFGKERGSVTGPLRPRSALVIGSTAALSALELFKAGNCSAQDSDSLPGHLRAPEAEMAEPGQCLQVLQAGIRHPGFLQEQSIQVDQRLEVNEAGVGDRRVAQVEALEPGQALQVNQIRVGKRGVRHVERFESRETFD